ncbi:FGGY-family carbohydrate kinase [Microbacterium sp. M3]|uniref:FGGY-family carbohydrate kinase n=1 Tax=Microbacterium arthrosphaerae TaxID=792652 RepID=A0ABU4GXX5_9MICO|nr:MULTISPECIES: FGGY-family carbohydrate kinase [Microbacterium]MDW4571931.1 FGGY-family carbohydrate kinase [Microbacterium arthrosphaerae]MDW7605786.1 FGGY-family carbohydrate kinase [Microbacterium sp. M3]
MSDAAAQAIRDGRTALGIELGSTRIKACLIDADDPATVLAVGAHAWENRYESGLWTYSLEDVWSGLQAAYADLAADVQRRHGVTPETFGAVGVSAMMHGYLAFDDAGELLAPFRTWRNTNTGAAAAELTEAFGVNIPLRWSIAHLHQVVLDGEAHLGDVRFVTTLAGYVHWRLTGEKVLGVGDASGMFPIDSATVDYDAVLLARYDALAAGRLPAAHVADLLPKVLAAGAPAGALTAEGAALLDPSGTLRPGIRFCAPEGDAGTGMVATGAVAPRTGNVSAGTSIFAMVVLERPLAEVHHELDLVTTPSGDPVAMVHCNNGASELAAWAGMFARFAETAGTPLADDAVYETLFREALAGEADAGGLLAYNHLAGEPIAGLTEGRPLFVRTPDSRFTLANVMRAQLYGVFGTLALGMRVLEGEGVGLDRMFAHGGMFRTAGVAQRFLAGALGAPVSVGDTASEGGAWGIAVLAAYARAVADADDLDASAARPLDPAASAEASIPLAVYLDERVFAGAAIVTAEPDPSDAAGFAAYLDRYRAGLAVEAAAVSAL